MRFQNDEVKRLRVVVTTPLGPQGRGGIDRLMDSLRDALPDTSNVEITSLTTRGPGSILVSPFFFFIALSRLTQIRVRGGCDLIHINLASRGSTWRKLILARWARILGIPYVLHLHGALYREFFEDARPWQQRLIRSMFVNARRVIVLGSPWRDFVVKARLAEPNRVALLPNASPRGAPSHRLHGERCQLLFLGRLGQRKGSEDLIRALGELSHRSDWCAVLAGDGEVERARALVAALGLTQVQIPGWCDARATETLLRSSAILVLPSYAENLPMAVIEGMGHGLAIVTTPVGATLDIVQEGHTGLLVKPGDVQGLVSAITRLLDDPALRESLGRNAWEYHASNLSLPAFCERLVLNWREVALCN